MSWTITPQQKVPVDPYRSQVSLLLHGDGANGSTTITDSSPTPKTVTAVGNAQISTAQSRFGGSSIVFDKVDDRLTLVSNSDFSFGTGDFTIEFWAYSRDVLSSSQRGYMQISATTGGLSASRAGALAFAQGIGATGGFTGGLALNIDNSWLRGDGAVLTAGTWQFIVACRQSGTLRLFVDGTLHLSGTRSGNITGSNLVVGGYDDTNYLYDGYIDELRITKGVARYTSNFTPPTATFPDI